MVEMVGIEPTSREVPWPLSTRVVFSNFDDQSDNRENLETVDRTPVQGRLSF